MVVLVLPSILQMFLMGVILLVLVLLLFHPMSHMGMILILNLPNLLLHPKFSLIFLMMMAGTFNQQFLPHIILLIHIHCMLKHVSHHQMSPLILFPTHPTLSLTRFVSTLLRIAIISADCYSHAKPGLRNC